MKISSLKVGRGSPGPALIDPFAFAGPPVMRDSRLHRLADADDVVARELDNLRSENLATSFALS